jgi:signal transduction histidine kinase
MPQRFLLLAIPIVALAMAGLGWIVGRYVQDGITRGVASTAAASIEALILHEAPEFGTRPLTEIEVGRLDAVFTISNEAHETRLIEVRLRDLDGRLLYQSGTELSGEAGEEEDRLIDLAPAGVQSRITSVLLVPIAGVPALPIEVLEIFMPLRRPGTNEAFAIAELYYSAKAVLEQRNRAQAGVWLPVGAVAVLVVIALYLLVMQAAGTVARQRARLSENLAASRRLSEENRRLHEASETLRQQASFASEALLAQVGSDIHDGPIQVLTLAALRLSGDPETAKLTREAIEELRNISNGLVLPELGEASLETAIVLALKRHEQLTGVSIGRLLVDLPREAPLLAKVCAFRVVQEGLTNAFRHGSREKVVVTARLQDGDLYVTVENPSHPETDTRAQPGLGLRGMRYRVEALGGRLDLRLNEEGRTVVQALIPLSPAGLPDRPPARH